MHEKLRNQSDQRVHVSLCCAAPQKLPESSPAKMEEVRKRNALVMQAIKEAAETNDNILREIGPPIK